MSIYRVIDRLEEYLRESTLLPFRRRVVSEEKILDLIEKMRATLPEEVGRAKLIAKDKDRMLREAQERAQAIVSEASEHHAQMLNNHEIVQQARTTADVVLKEAEERERKIREGADQYAAVVLGDLQNRLSVALASVKKGQETLGVRQIGTSAAITEAAAESKRAAFDSLAPEAQADAIERTHLMVETAELEIS